MVTLIEMLKSLLLCPDDEMSTHTQIKKLERLQDKYITVMRHRSRNGEGGRGTCVPPIF